MGAKEVFELEVKEFRNKEEAKKFAKENKGFIEYCIDDKANVIYYVFYKQHN